MRPKRRDVPAYRVGPPDAGDRRLPCTGLPRTINGPAMPRAERCAAVSHAYPLCATCNCERPRLPNSGSAVIPVGAKTPNFLCNSSDLLSHFHIQPVIPAPVSGTGQALSRNSENPRPTHRCPSAGYLDTGVRLWRTSPSFAGMTVCVLDRHLDSELLPYWDLSVGLNIYGVVCLQSAATIDSLWAASSDYGG